MRRGAAGGVDRGAQAERAQREAEADKARRRPGSLLFAPLCALRCADATVLSLLRRIADVQPKSESEPPPPPSEVSSEGAPAAATPADETASVAPGA